MTISVAALSGCGVYGKYSKATEVDANLYGSENIHSDTTSIAALSFQDAYLQRLIDTALVNNADLRAARLRVEQAEATLLAARLSYLPSIGFSAEGGVSRMDGTTSETYSLGGTASWEIDIFGKHTAAKREARASLESTRAYQQAVHTSLVASVASAYYTLLMMDEQIAIGERTLQNWEKTVSTLRP